MADKMEDLIRRASLTQGAAPPPDPDRPVEPLPVRGAVAVLCLFVGAVLTVALGIALTGESGDVLIGLATGEAVFFMGW